MPEINMSGLIFLVISALVMLSIGAIIFAKMSSSMKGLDIANSTHPDYDPDAAGVINDVSSYGWLGFTLLPVAVLMIIGISILGIFAIKTKATG